MAPFLCTLKMECLVYHIGAVDMVELVCQNFGTVIVLYNGSNPLELGFVEEQDQIKATLWCAGPGNTGFEALGKILKGEVNPSGRTTDTFVYPHGKPG